jgi:hypothetical protein
MKKFFTVIMLVLLFNISFYHSFAQCEGDTVSKYTELFGDISAIGVSNSFVVTGHEGGLSVYNGDLWATYTDADFQEVSGIAVTDMGKVYAACNYHGFLVWENSSTKTLYDTNDGLHSYEMEGVKIAPDGKVWIGSFGSGVCCFDGTNFTRYNTSNGLPDDYVVDFDFDDKGNVYMASWNGDVIVFDGSSFSTITPPDVNEVSGVAWDRKGGLWITAYSHTANNFLVHYDGSKFETIQYPMNTFPSVSETDLSGNLWLGAWNGCMKYDGDRWKVYTTKEGLYEDEVQGLGLNQHDEVWIAGSTGLSKLGEYSVMKGFVIADPDHCEKGYAKLYKKTSGVKMYEQYDSVALNSVGEYTFSNVPVGTYIIYAVPDEAMYPDFVGTYTGNVELWSSATSINVAFCDTTYSGIEILLQEKTIIPPGKGYISGHIKSADGTRAGSEPIKDVDVTLRKVPGGVVKQTKTNQFGFYEFDALSNGVYGIVVDMPGLELDSVRTVEITDEDTTHNDQDYEVDSTGVHTGDFSSIDQQEVLTKSVVYPVPASEMLNIYLTNTTKQPIEITLINANGAVLYRNSIQGDGDIRHQIDVSDYPNGVYLLRLHSGQAMKIIKVLLN